MKVLANKELRKLIKLKGYAHWEVAELVGIGESTFSKMLRRELSNEQTQELVEKINLIKGRVK